MLLEMVMSIITQANLLISYWRYVLLTTTYVLNRIPSKSVSSTLYELWTCRKSKLFHLHPWETTTYVYKHGKLGPKRKKCMFIRYA